MQLIVGLGNPGAEYADTRHNAGAWFVEALAKQENSTWQLEKKFQAQITKCQVQGHPLFLLLPTTYMNHSGRAVAACARFYKIPPEEILVAHDDLDLPTGAARLKQGGGDGGHNGLKDITQQLQTANYFRLRLGIAHPGHRDRVLSYVLQAPKQEEKILMLDAIDRALKTLSLVLHGELNKAMTELNARQTS